jgi:hypothetical protein
MMVGAVPCGASIASYAMLALATSAIRRFFRETSTRSFVSSNVQQAFNKFQGFTKSLVYYYFITSGSFHLSKIKKNNGTTEQRNNNNNRTHVESIQSNIKLSFCIIMMVSMKEYDLFHRMMAKPTIAKNCIKSFVKSNGCILFLPSDHGDNEIYLYDASHGNALSLISYYALVLFSFTGLSTILGMTDTVDIQDYSTSGGLPIWPVEEVGKAAALTKSILNPQICVRDCALKYVQNHTETFHQKDGKSCGKDSQKTIKLQRRFEYNFRLCGGLNVIMLHLTSSDCPGVLHLVEVYKVQNPVLRFISSYVFHFLGVVFVGSNKKLK